MAYDVFALGDGEVLYNAFNGAAMIFNGNAIYNLIRAGFVIGTIHLCVSYLLNLELRLYQMGVSLLFYLLLFQPKTTVNIEDIYTAEVRTVANVPLGVALPMSIVSSMGLSVANLFETAYSVPNAAYLTEAGYLNPLAVLVKLRNLGIGSAGSDKDGNGDLKRSLKQYVERCVMLDMDLAQTWQSGLEVTPEQLKKSPDIWAAMKTTFLNVDVRIDLPTVFNRTQANCQTAYEKIDEYLKGEDFNKAIDKVVKSRLGVYDEATAEEHIAKAFAGLNDVIGVDAQTFIRNAIMVSTLKDGPAAFITRSGIETLNMQWASEQSMFNQIAKPLMSFVEMFVVAVSPIMAFLSTLGGFGIMMMGRYLQLIAWVTLWPPLMAVCNLYVMIVTNKVLAVKAANVAENGVGLASMYMHDELFHELEVQLATGGMLAASVPAISLMVVYGGSVAATNMAGRMTSAAATSTKPEMLTPKPIDVSSVGNMGPMINSSPNTGPKLDGMADTQVKLGSRLSAGIDSARDTMNGTQRQVASAAGQILSSSHGSSRVTADARSVMSAINEINREGVAFTNTNGTTTTVKDAITGKEMESINALVSAGLSTGLGPDLLKVAARAGLDSSAGVSAEKAHIVDQAVDRAVQMARSEGHELGRSSGESNNSSTTTSGTDSQSDNRSKEYKLALQRYAQASEKYGERASLEKFASRELGLSYNDLASRLVKSPETLVELANALKEKTNSMTSQQRVDLSRTALNDIDRSSAMPLSDDRRPALATYLQLEKVDPGTASEIVVRNLMSSLPDSGTDIKPNSFAGESVPIEALVSDKDAAEWLNKAESAGRRAEGTPVDTWRDAPESKPNSAAASETDNGQGRLRLMSPDDEADAQGSNGNMGGEQPWYDDKIGGKSTLFVNPDEVTSVDGHYLFDGHAFRGRGAASALENSFTPSDNPGRERPPSGHYTKKGDAMIYEGPFEGAETNKSATQASGPATPMPSDVVNLPKPAGNKLESGSVEAQFNREMANAGGRVDPVKEKQYIEKGGHLDRDKSGALELMRRATTYVDQKGDPGKNDNKGSKK